MRTLSRIDPRRFDEHVGAYSLESGSTVAFWRDGERLKSRIWGQAVAEVFPGTSGEYFLRTINAHWMFSNGTDDDDMAVLNQNELKFVARRIKGDAGDAALELSKVTEMRFLAQKPATGSEPALRSLLASLGKGEPEYENMRPEFAAIVRRQREKLQRDVTNLGPVHAIAFKRVNRAGGDEFEVKFERGTRVCAILLGVGGTIHGANLALQAPQLP